MPAVETIRVRPIEPDEADVVRALFGGLSERSRFYRFHAPVPRLTRSWLRWLTQSDGRDRVVVVAEVDAADGAVPVGIGHLIRIGDGEAEVAVAVIDSWHRRGVAKRLCLHLGGRAAELGIRRVHAHVLTENRAALALIHALSSGAGVPLDFVIHH